jgi:hypothetical protein
MTAPTRTDVPSPTARRRSSPLPALAGLGALAAFAGTVVFFADPLRGSTDPAAAAEALSGATTQTAAPLIGAYALLAIAVVGALAHRLGRPGDSPAVRLLPLLGAAHVLLLTVTVLAPAAAVAVGTLVLDTGVTPTAAETALVLMNLAAPLAAWVGAGFLVAVSLAARGASRTLVIVSAVFAAGLLLPPIGWAVTYLMALWFAGVGIWLWLRD